MEGDTYVSNIGQEKKNPDFVKIPNPSDSIKQVTSETSHVTFDLETGGLMRSSDILQISAVNRVMEFNTYITPTWQISKGSSAVTKLRVIYGQLHHDEKVGKTLSIKDALLQFTNFLKAIQSPGHNIKAFDLVFLFNNLVKCEILEGFLSTVIGFVDTLLVYMKEFPERDCYKQEVLMAELLHETYCPHNALEDVKA